MRRLQRGMKTIDGLLRTAKAGKPVNEDDIPPPVATGQAPGSSAPSASSSTTSIQQQQPPTMQSDLADSSPPVVPPPKTLSPPVNPSQPPSAIPTPLVQVSPVSPAAEKKPVNEVTVRMLEARQHEYRNAALEAKKAGNKEEALKYFRFLKVHSF